MGHRVKCKNQLRFPGVCQVCPCVTCGGQQAVDLRPDGGVGLDLEAEEGELRRAAAGDRLRLKIEPRDCVVEMDGWMGVGPTDRWHKRVQALRSSGAGVTKKVCNWGNTVVPNMQFIGPKLQKWQKKFVLFRNVISSIENIYQHKSKKIKFCQNKKTHSNNCAVQSFFEKAQ